MQAKGQPIPWNRAAFAWSSPDGINERGEVRPTVTKLPPTKGTPYTWSDVYFVVEALGEPYNPLMWSPEKKRRFVKLLCKVKGIDYIEGKEVEKTQIFITDIALVAKEVAGITIQIEV